MNWYVYAVAAAVLIAICTVIQKRTLRTEHAMEFSTIFAFANLILCIPFFFVIDYSRLESSHLFLLAITSIIGALSFLYSIRALRHMDISESTPFYVLAPALTAILAALFLGEYLTLLQVSGIGLLVIGAYSLEVRGVDLLQPFRVFRNSKYIHYVLFSIILMSIGAVLDRTLLHVFEIQAEAFLAFVHLFHAIFFMVIFRIGYGKLSLIKSGVKEFGFIIIIIAFLTIIHQYAQIVSVQMANVALVTAIKRSSTLFIVIIGGRMFQEKNLLLKTVACGVMIAGMLLIIF